LAHASGVITAGSKELIDSLAKALPYADRHFSTILRLAEHQGLDSSTIGTFRDWLKVSKVDQKREDARELLGMLKGEVPRPRATQAFSFSHSDAWESLCRTINAAPRVSVGCEHVELLDELCASGELPALHQSSLLRALALDCAQVAGGQLNNRAIAAFADEFRRERGLAAASAFEAWLTSQGLQDDADAEAFFSREATIRAVSDGETHRLHSAIIDCLRARGSYGETTLRATERAERISALGLENATLEDTGLSEDELWSWFFSRTGTTQSAYSEVVRSALLRSERLRKVVVQSYLCDQRTNGQG
jgi:hypothetical protein